MPSAIGISTPGLTTFTRSVRSRGTPIESSIDNLISLLKRRQIRYAKGCAIATAILLWRLVETFKVIDVAKLIERVQQVGRQLVAAQPRELAIGNVVRRVLGVIREEAEETRDEEIKGDGNASIANESQSPRESTLPNTTSGSPNGVAQSLLTSTSMFSVLSQHLASAATDSKSSGFPSTPTNHAVTDSLNAKDFRAEVVEGIQEILDELNQADDQIASYALDHIHSSEIILTHSSSITVQKFLLKAGAKRRFTVVYAETYPNDYQSAHATLNTRGKGEPDGEFSTEAFTKTLAAAGITVILIPDSAVFALMSRVNKVVLSAHAVLGDGSLIAAAGSKAIAKAAHMQRTHVVVLTAVYQLSPAHPFDPDSLMEDGDPCRIISFDDGNFIDRVEIENPLLDFVPAEVVDLYISNLGGHARSSLNRVVQDHYRTEDMNFESIVDFQ